MWLFKSYDHAVFFNDDDVDDMGPKMRKYLSVRVDSGNTSSPKQPAAIDNNETIEPQLGLGSSYTTPSSLWLACTAYFKSMVITKAAKVSNALNVVLVILMTDFTLLDVSKYLYLKPTKFTKNA